MEQTKQTDTVHYKIALRVDKDGTVFVPRRNNSEGYGPYPRQVFEVHFLKEKTWLIKND